MELQDREQKLDAAIDHMFALETALELALKGEAEAEHKHDQDFASAFLEANGSNADKCKQQARLKVSRQSEALLKAQAATKFLQVKMKNAQTAVSARQSLLSHEKNRAV